MIGDIKVWRLTPSQKEDYKPGMDLGKPHKIVKPKKRVIGAIEIDPWGRVRKNSITVTKKAKGLTHEIYKRLKSEGHNDIAISEMFGIKRPTLATYKTNWRKGGKI